MTLVESDNFLSKESIEYSDKIIEELFDVKVPLNWNHLKREEKSKLVHQWARKAFPNVPESLVSMTVGLTVDGNAVKLIDQVPEWLDPKKLACGQKFARDNIFGIYFSVLLALFALFSFKEGFKPLIATRKSSESYTAFKRYLSTGVRVRNWYTSDFWTKGTPAYNDMIAVRRIHAIVRDKLNGMSKEEVDKAATIKNPWSPMRNILSQDFWSTCSEALPGQCPFAIEHMGSIRPRIMNQGEMAVTQGGFICLAILYPQAFGLHAATDKDLDNFCYIWRCIGYLLGIDDEFNFCRGSFDDIKQRSADYLNEWVKPNLRDITPEWEHMMRCITASSEYYSSNASDSSYEIILLYLTELMNLDMPRLRAALSYRDWIKYYFIKFTMYYAMRIPQIRRFAVSQTNKTLDNASKFTKEKHKELQDKSSKLLYSVRANNNNKNISTENRIVKILLIFVLLHVVINFFFLIS